MDRSFHDLTDEDEWLTRAQVATVLAVSPSTVTRWADEGRLRCVRTLGGHRRYHKREIAQIVRLVQSSEPCEQTQEEERMEEIQLKIPRLYGDHHTIAIHQALAQLPGLQQIWVSPATHQVRVSFDPAQIDAEAIITRLTRAGYPNGSQQLDRADHQKDPAWAKLSLRMTQTYTNAM